MPTEEDRLRDLTRSTAASSTAIQLCHNSNVRSKPCCVSFTSVFKLIFCVNIKRSSRVKILWFWITSISITAGVLMSQVIFGPVTRIISPTDMRIVDSKVSTIFCESLVLDSQWTTFSAYLLPAKPDIVFNKLDRFEVRRNKFLHFGEYKYWNFYLLQQSEVTIKSCTDGTVYLYVIRGQRNLKRWLRYKYCDNCYVEKQLINVACPSKTTYNFKADVTDEYYFVYMNSNEKTWLTLQIILERSLYDTSNAKDSCAQSIWCSLNLNIESDQVIVYQISNDDQKFDFDDITITTSCSPRRWIYLLLFLFLPFSLGIAFCSIVYIACKDPRTTGDVSDARTRARSRIARQYLTERTPLLWAHAPYIVEPAVPICPPKYEDIVFENDTSPPSYEEAVG